MAGMRRYRRFLLLVVLPLVALVAGVSPAVANQDHE